MVRDRRTFQRTSFAERIPVVGSLASLLRKLAALRAGRVPIGLLTLLPVALLLDFFDAGDELLLGPIGMGTSFLLESAFLLAVTGRPTYALGFAGLDLIPFVDVIPFATITLAREIVRAWNEPPSERAPDRPQGPVIDV